MKSLRTSLNLILDPQPCNYNLTCRLFLGVILVPQVGEVGPLRPPASCTVRVTMMKQSAQPINYFITAPVIYEVRVTARHL